MVTSTFSEIKKSILAGIAITIGGTVYLSCIDKGFTWVGAILFAIGLYTILEYSYNLYTGKVGYLALQLTNASYYGLVLLILVFNILTTFGLGVLIGKVYPQVRAVAIKIYEAKLTIPYWKSFVSAAFCGMLMFLAVDTWRRGNRFPCFIYVPVFILSGFDHSIANSVYNGMALSEFTFTMNNLYFVLIVIAGNAVGGMLIPLLTREWKQ